MNVDDGVTVYNKFVKAQLVRMAECNPQSQPRIVWPAAFPVVRSYLDQLARGNGLPAARTTAIESALAAAEKQSGAERSKALTTLAAQVDADVTVASDPARVRAMSAAIHALAAASR